MERRARIAQIFRAHFAQCIEQVRQEFFSGKIPIVRGLLFLGAFVLLIYSCSLSSSRYYLIQKDDTPQSIAKHFSISEGDLKKKNQKAKWSPGEKVFIPFESFTQSTSQVSLGKVGPIKGNFRKFGLDWPVRKHIITSGFGVRGYRFHEGIDLSGPRHTPVYASRGGSVVYASSQLSGYGRMVIIDHGDGIRTVYAHLQKFVVKKGQKVEKGKMIGAIGTSGKATGPHLHFEVRNGTKAHDPIYYLPASAAIAEVKK